MKERESLLPLGPASYIVAEDGDWTYYVGGHDENELTIVDDLDVLEWERCWMRPIPASEARDHGFDWPPEETVRRDAATGKFTQQHFWIECGESHPDAQPYLGVRYKRRALAS